MLLLFGVALFGQELYNVFHDGTHYLGKRNRNSPSRNYVATIRGCTIRDRALLGGGSMGIFVSGDSR